MRRKLAGRCRAEDARTEVRQLLASQSSRVRHFSSVVPQMSKNRLYRTFENNCNFNSSAEKSNQCEPQQAQRKTKILKSSVLGSEKQREEKKNAGKTIENGSSSISDSDSSDSNSFFASKSDTKLMYTRAEDELIVEYVLQGENIFRTSSISLWKRLELKKVKPKRTYQSLKNRFLRNIKPKLFTTYGHLIKNKETVDRILSKFPELKKSLRYKQSLTNIHLPKRKKHLPEVSRDVENRSPGLAGKKSGERPEKTSAGRECNGVSGPEVTEEANCEKPQPEPQPLNSTSDAFPATTHSRKVVCKNDSIVVTVTVNEGKDSRTKKSGSEPSGIYQKYLKHKRSNVIIPCSACGRGGLAGDWSEDSDTDAEGRLVIGSPLTTSHQNSKTPRTHHSDEDDPAKNRSMEEDCDATACSPSILGNTEACSPNIFGGTPQMEEEPTGNGKAIGHPRELETPREKRKALQELVSDEDLETLYRNTISFCRALMNFESPNEDEKEAGVVGEDPGVRFQPIRSCRKGNESFFVNSEAGNTARKESEGVLVNMLKIRKICQEQR